MVDFAETHRFARLARQAVRRVAGPRSTRKDLDTNEVRASGLFGWAPPGAPQRDGAK